MAFSNVGSMNLGKLLKIVSKGMVYDNLSTSSELWNFVLGKKSDNPAGREDRFSLRTSLGPAAGGFIGVDGASYRAAQAATIVEGVAQFKKFSTTIEVQNSLIELAMSDFARYGEPIAEEIEAKGIALARQLSMAAWRDGTGVVGVLAGAAASGGKVVFTLSSSSSSKGSVNWFDVGDRFICTNTAGTDHMLLDRSGGTTAAIFFQVDETSRSARTVTCTAYSSVSATITATGVTQATSPAATDVLYRYGESAIDLTALTSTSDYNALTNELAGMEALASADAIKVHDVQYGGVVKGSHKDCSAAVIDSSHFQDVMSSIIVNVGPGRYKYKDAFMSPETYDAILESRETDRRFNSVDDADRGSKSMGYQWGNQRLAFITDPLCRQDRIWIVPADAGVLEFVGKDFEPVKAQGGSEFHLKVDASAGVHKDVQQMYMTGMGVLICKHPAAIGCIKNFTN